MISVSVSDFNMVRWLSDLDRLSEVVPTVVMEGMSEPSEGLFRAFGRLEGRLRFEMAVLDVIIGWSATRGENRKWAVTIDDPSAGVNPGLRGSQIWVGDRDGNEVSLSSEAFEELARDFWQLLPAEDFVIEFLEELNVFAS